MTTYVGTLGSDNVTSAYDTLYGLDGDDILASNTAGFNYIEGGQGNDCLFIYGGAAYGHIYGGDGSDLVTGDVGSDWLDGGFGNDLVTGGNFALPGGQVSSTAASGNDILLGNAGTDAVYGFDGDDFIYGGDGDDSSSNTVTVRDLHGSNFMVAAGLYGGDGNDYIDGGLGRDVIFGGNGSDILLGGHDLDFDTIVGGDGDDSIYGTDGGGFLEGDGGADAVIGGSGVDTIYGDGSAGGVPGNDWLEGNDGNDILFGQAGNDVLYGGNGNDWLIGGPGFDNLFGGLGADTFYVDSPTDGYDYIGDFKAGEWDALVLTSANFGGLTSATIGSHFYAGAGFGGFAVSGPYFAFDTVTGNLWYNTPGAPTLVAQLPAVNLSSANMYFA
jgi:Ca2+-binding RTX toxin-like protein